MTEAKAKSFEHWAVVELMGRQSVAGRCSEESIAGGLMLRVDIPNGEGFITRYFGSSAIYAISITGEAEARAMAKNNRDHRPPFAYQVEQSLLPPTAEKNDDDMFG